MRDDLYNLTIADAGLLIERNEISPVELTQSFLDRIESLNPKLHAYITVTAERALSDARRAESEISSGRYRGPLLGIPIAVKDTYETSEIRTTCNSHLFADYIPERDAKAVELLKHAGTVLLGKLNTHEFGFGGPDWDLPCPPACNPWKLDHFTGGSSSGSGAAIAAGLAMAAIGTDAAGSIRVPAFYCGITGLKPTYGRVSRRGVAPLAYSLDHCGPMAWTAHDAALMLGTIAGVDPEDLSSADIPVPDYVAGLSGDVKGLRIGLIRHFYEEDEKASPDMKAAMNTAIEVLSRLGATIEDVKLSSLQDYHACCMVILLTEALAVHERDLNATPEKYGEVFRDRLMLGSVLTGLDYVQALRLRRKLSAEVTQAFQQYDVLLTAGGLDGAPKLQEVDKLSVYKKPLLTTPFNVTGNPAIAVCNGFTTAGLPLGMQIVGPPFNEQIILRVADAYESATEWRQRRPSLLA